MARHLVQLLAALALIGGGAALIGGCGGESKQDQAKKAVCDARDDIGEQVDTLAGLTISTATVDQVRSSLQAIQNDLETISDNRADLPDDRRQEIEAATTRFTDTVRTAVGDLGRSLSLSEARGQLSTALTELKNAYRTTLAQTRCD